MLLLNSVHPHGAGPGLGSWMHSKQEDRVQRADELTVRTRLGKGEVWGAQDTA